MKRKIKIRGFACGRNQTITKTMEVPEFEESYGEFCGTKFKIGIKDKENQWIEQNYDRIIDGVFGVSLDCIFDASFIQEKQTKKEQIREILTELFTNEPETLKETLIIIANLWDSVKGMSAVKIVETALKSRNIATNAVGEAFKQLNERIEKQVQARKNQKLLEK